MAHSFRVWFDIEGSNTGGQCSLEEINGSVFLAIVDFELRNPNFAVTHRQLLDGEIVEVPRREVETEKGIRFMEEEMKAQSVYGNEHHGYTYLGKDGQVEWTPDFEESIGE